MLDFAGSWGFPRCRVVDARGGGWGDAPQMEALLVRVAPKVTLGPTVGCPTIQ